MWPAMVNQGNKDDNAGDIDVISAARVEEPEKFTKQKGLHKIEDGITVDSGVAENVWPQDLPPEVEMVPSAGAKKGQFYATATRARTYNRGQKHGGTVYS